MDGNQGSGHEGSVDRFADDPAFAVHEGGKLSVTPTRSIDSIADLALTYTPGVARVSSAIAAEPELARRFTWAPRVVAIVSDGTAVLGLGNIGPTASLPVMEGKACLFKEFGGLDAVPIILSTTDVDTIVETVAAIAPSFGGINLEDISAPRCFEIEDRLRERLDIPVMHDDQHGTAIVVLAALRNAAKVVGRDIGDLRVVVAGAGAAGVATTKILLGAGIGEIAVADSQGVLHAGREDLTPVKQWLVDNTNRVGVRRHDGGRARGRGRLRGALRWVGAGGGDRLDGAELHRVLPRQPDARGRPGDGGPLRRGRGHRAQRPAQPDQQRARLPRHLPRGDRRARDAITEEMKLAAATAIADVVGDEVRADYIVPSPLDRRVATAVAEAVATCAREQGVTT